uniref:9,13-epoxylabda-14-ene synthase, chloroplastic n=1 Tax=Marrubium vulgare TaxID=41230 RepID=ELS_MARVU|nr:RecName: Full=9,13-epoxylabda-14-ene synthase, chloroplastic; AltName: Full=Manoyl oxide synthase; AltName: Full=Miltiradiene synthase; Flags: Precursor [Marrubium vulgare]AIE77094.1 9,13-epoxy-labd-14-en synthase [Marrubium vulgare]
MSITFNLKIAPFSGPGIQRSKETFPATEIQITASTKSTMTTKCSFNASTDFMGKLREKVGGKADKPPVVIHPVDISSNLCMIDTLQSLGVDRYFQSEINTLLEHTYRLWKEKKKNIIFKDVSCCAIAFRLLREKGYQVSSDKLAPFADYRIRDVATILELYRASQARLYEDEHTLEKLHDWSSNLLKQHLLNGSIPDHKLHKQVEYFLKNYHGILDRVAVRRSLDLYNINHHHRIPDVADGFPKEDFLEYSMQDFNICQAQQQEELHQLQRWYADCRLDTLNYGRDVVRIANFLTSAIFGEPEFSDARLAFAKHIILVTRIDDFFDHGGSREESYKILDLVQEWKEKPAEEYGSKEVEILFTAVYNTVNDLAEKAHIEQGRCVKPLLIKLWVEILTSFKKELDSWTEETALTLDEYLSSSWVSIGCRICILNSLQYLGIKLSEEMLSSQECTDLCRHVSSVDRLLNDVQTFKKERLENTINSVGLQLAAHKGERAMTEEDAMSKIKEMADYHRRKLMQIVYKEGTVFPRECKDVFLRVCRIGYYLYSSGDEFTSPQQMKEDMKSLVYQPVKIHPLEAINV